MKKFATELVSNPYRNVLIRKDQIVKFFAAETKLDKATRNDCADKLHAIIHNATVMAMRHFNMPASTGLLLHFGAGRYKTSSAFCPYPKSHDGRLFATHIKISIFEAMIDIAPGITMGHLHYMIFVLFHEITHLHQHLSRMHHWKGKRGIWQGDDVMAYKTYRGKRGDQYRAVPWERHANMEALELYKEFVGQNGYELDADAYSKLAKYADDPVKYGSQYMTTAFTEMKLLKSLNPKTPRKEKKMKLITLEAAEMLESSMDPGIVFEFGALVKFMTSEYGWTDDYAKNSKKVSNWLSQHPCVDKGERGKWIWSGTHFADWLADNPDAKAPVAKQEAQTPKEDIAKLPDTDPDNQTTVDLENLENDPQVRQEIERAIDEAESRMPEKKVKEPEPKKEPKKEPEDTETIRIDMDKLRDLLATCPIASTKFECVGQFDDDVKTFTYWDYSYADNQADRHCYYQACIAMRMRCTKEADDAALLEMRTLFNSWRKLVAKRREQENSGGIPNIDPVPTEQALAVHCDDTEILFLEDFKKAAYDMISV